MVVAATIAPKKTWTRALKLIQATTSVARSLRSPVSDRIIITWTATVTMAKNKTSPNHSSLEGRGRTGPIFGLDQKKKKAGEPIVAPRCGSSKTEKGLVVGPVGRKTLQVHVLAKSGGLQSSPQKLNHLARAPSWSLVPKAPALEASTRH